MTMTISIARQDSDRRQNQTTKLFHFIQVFPIFSQLRITR